MKDTPISDETLVPGVLLQRSGLLKRYFSKYKNDKLKEKGMTITEIKDFLHSHPELPSESMPE